MTKTAIKPGTYLYPVPAVMVTCGPFIKPNIITLAWVGTVCSEPPMVGISIRPSRFSHDLIKQQLEFAVNVPSVDLVRVTDYCGVVSGRKVDKFAATGLTPVRGQAIDTALIGECPLNIECKLMQVVPLGSHDLFLGQVVAVQADESLLNAQGELDLSRAELFAYSGARYWGLGSLLGVHGFSAKS
jgi:flavin reductase (DIM6/NTAB) family NADH-FMN oxidoreductase RutF